MCNLSWHHSRCGWESEGKQRKRQLGCAGEHGTWWECKAPAAPTPAPTRQCYKADSTVVTLNSPPALPPTTCFTRAGAFRSAKRKRGAARGVRDAGTRASLPQVGVHSFPAADAGSVGCAQQRRRRRFVARRDCSSGGGGHAAWAPLPFRHAAAAGDRRRVAGGRAAAGSCVTLWSAAAGGSGAHQQHPQRGAGTAGDAGSLVGSARAVGAGRHVHATATAAHARHGAAGGCAGAASHAHAPWGAGACGRARRRCLAGLCG